MREMTIEQAIETIITEKKCVMRNIAIACNRDCYDCDLVLPDEQVAAGYYAAIEALKKQIPKKPVDVCEPCVKWGICPTCKGELNMLGGKPNRIFGSEKYCKDCGQAIDWSE